MYGNFVKAIMYLCVVSLSVLLLSGIFVGLEKYVEVRSTEKANVFIQGYEAELYKNPYFQQARQLTMKAIEEQNKKAQQEKK